MKTTMPSKNLPVAASVPMSHCMPVVGVARTDVSSRHSGVSSMWDWTDLRAEEAN